MLFRGFLLFVVLILAGCLQAESPDEDASLLETAADVPGPDAHAGSDDAGPGYWPVARLDETARGEREWIFYGVDRLRDGGCVEDGERFEEVEAMSSSDAPRLVRLLQPGCFVEGVLQVDTDADLLKVTLRMALLDKPGDAEGGRLRLEMGHSSISIHARDIGWAQTSTLRAWEGEQQVRIVADEENRGAVYLDSIRLEESKGLHEVSDG